MGIAPCFGPCFGRVDHLPENLPLLVPVDVPQSEANILVAFYNATDGPNWTNNDGWLTAPVVGNWYGVTVEDGHVTKLNLATDANIKGDCSVLQYLTSLTYLHLYGTRVSGDISGFSAPKSLTFLNLARTGVSGDVSGFAALTLLRSLYLYDTDVSGDISGYSVLTSLLDLQLHSTGVSGDVSGFAALTLLRSLYLHGTDVSGDISEFDTLTSMAYFQIQNTDVSGDAAFLHSMPLLRLCFLYATGLSDYTFGAPLPAWSAANIGIGNLGWTTDEVGGFLIDADDGGGVNCILNISGSNAAPTWGTEDEPSDVALAVVGLLDKGWTLTVTGGIPQWVLDIVP